MRKFEYFLQRHSLDDEPINECLIPDTCLSKAADDEPIFILRANDPTAAAVIEIWAILNTRRTYEKIREAQRCAELMRQWKLKQLQARVDALGENREVPTHDSGMYPGLD